MNIFIFRRDLRIHDNKAMELLRSSIIKSSETVTPIFIFNRNQCDPKKNEYFSAHCFAFLLGCLADLQKETHNSLSFYISDSDITILNALHKASKINSIAFNEDYTPFARKRDHDIKEWCNINGVNCVTSLDDYTLVSFDNNGKKPYLKFTPFYEKNKDARFASNKNMGNTKPTFSKVKIEPVTSIKTSLEKIQKQYLEKANPLFHQNSLKPGRKYGLEIIDAIKSGKFANFDKTKDIPSQSTTHLGPYLKFGCISLREAAIAATASRNKELLRQLLWRSFYDQVTWYFPNTLKKQIDKKVKNEFYRNRKESSHLWVDGKQKADRFQAWKQGRTGFPIVDAGMRELSETGYMHNRVRMLAANVLIKNLHIDWREGEKYFATQLVDYHPTANNGGWTGMAGGGVSAQPYFRIFNLAIQTKKYDKDNAYINKWLRDTKDRNREPIVDYTTTSKEYVQNYAA